MLGKKFWKNLLQRVVCLMVDEFHGTKSSKITLNNKEASKLQKKQSKPRPKKCWVPNLKLKKSHRIEYSRIRKNRWLCDTKNSEKPRLGKRNRWLLPSQQKTLYQVIQAVTFLSPSWRSLSLWKGHLNIPKGSPRIVREMIFEKFEKKSVRNQLEDIFFRQSLCNKKAQNQVYWDVHAT